MKTLSTVTTVNKNIKFSFNAVCTLEIFSSHHLPTKMAWTQFSWTCIDNNPTSWSPLPPLHLFSPSFPPFSDCPCCFNTMCVTQVALATLWSSFPPSPTSVADAPLQSAAWERPVPLSLSRSLFRSASLWSRRKSPPSKRRRCIETASTCWREHEGPSLSWSSTVWPCKQDHETLTQ